MILIIGGAHCGKRNYAATYLGYDLKHMSNQLHGAPVLYDLQALLQECADYEIILPALRQKQVIICNEVGCGVVPMDDHERTWRETVGRVCCMLAREADKVIRVQCGIGTVIKGE
ncbi:bifunctional adenosylcobinamide kinase/adenosylcobinamide-phosphate guanylyltransferase [Oscillospiraceae bacterium LTW-04]|nr:bifunctional adenosylcobinamide kinase/adenosylcobinamide-phosphate guanylyltransferase [Oscillospiraceae bacterium MB24-C1]